MSVLVGVLVSVAAAAAFFLLEPFLLGLEQTWRFVGTGVIFIAAAGLAIYVNKKITQTPTQTLESARRVLTDNEVGKDLSVDIDGLDTTLAEGNIITDNKVGGKATITVKDSKF